MATSGTSTFNLDIDEIIEEAYERAGLGRAYSGQDFKTARRSLNLLGQEFANRGINLWTVEDATQALTNGTSVYTLPADTVSILDYAIRTGAPLEVVENLQAIEDEDEEIYESIQEIWPDFPTEEDYLWNEEEY